MAKIPFDIKYRPQIESGEYKVILDCGVEAEILAWDKPGEYPIVCMAEKEGAIPFRTNSNGIAYHYPEGSNYSDLFIITPEPELTDCQKFISGCLQKYGLLDCGAADRIAKECSAELLDLARKQLVEEQYTSDPRKTDLYKLGKAEALRDLPRWKTWGNGACGSNSGLPIAIVKASVSGGYLLVPSLGISGEQYIMLSDLEKLEHE